MVKVDLGSYGICRKFKVDEPLHSSHRWRLPKGEDIWVVGKLHFYLFQLFRCKFIYIEYAQAIVNCYRLVLPFFSKISSKGNSGKFSFFLVISISISRSKIPAKPVHLFFVGAVFDHIQTLAYGQVSGDAAPGIILESDRLRTYFFERYYGGLIHG